MLECVFEEMCCPPHSPDLASNDFHLLPNLKKHLCGPRFSSSGEIKYIVTKELLKGQTVH